jgi:hypothetical protein
VVFVAVGQQRFEKKLVVQAEFFSLLSDADWPYACSQFVSKPCFLLSLNEAVAKKFRPLDLQTKKNLNEQKKNSHDEGRVEEHPPPLHQSLQDKEKKTKPNQARKILPSGQGRKRWQTSLISPKKQV